MAGDDVLSTDDNILLQKLSAAKKSIDMARRKEGIDKKNTKIERVPEYIHRQGSNFEKYYKPKEIAIGPIHHADSNLQKEELKLKLAAKFTGSTSGVTEKNFLREIKKNINPLKECFDETVIKSMSYDDEKLARMLFLDGCSVLQFIVGYVSEGLLDFKINNGQAALIKNDLFLLENQIPFEVLLLLMKLWRNNYTLLDSISEFILLNNMVPMNKYSLQRYSRIYHYLKQLCELEEQGKKKGKQPVHLLDLLRSEILFDLSLHDNDDVVIKFNSQEERPPKLSFRNVQDLKAAGIKVKPSYNCGLRSISFNTPLFVAGRLKLPPLIVDDSTAPKLLNLVAYEMCAENYTTDCAVASYLSFLDSLIDSEQDVKDLRSRHVLQNHLSSDAEVALLFNTIGKNSVPARDSYVEVKKKIQRHYDRRFVIWMAEVYIYYFKTPLTILALFAAAAALALTAIQAYYAIHPNKY